MSKSNKKCWVVMTTLGYVWMEDKGGVGERKVKGNLPPVWKIFLRRGEEMRDF